MKTALLGTFLAAAIVAVPAVSFAAMYQYVNTSGNLESITSDTAADALTASAATDRDPHSGVMLVNTDVTPVVTVTTSPTVMTTASTTGMIGSAGTYTGKGPGNTTGETMGLVLNTDGTAALATNYGNGESPMVETGTWIMNGSDQLQLTLTANNSVAYSPAHVITFTEVGNMLNAIQYDSSLYGSTGFSFTKVNQ